MELTIKLSTGNSAFDGEDMGPEIARILAALAKDFEENGSSGYIAHLRDINGNACGTVTLK